MDRIAKKWVFLFVFNALVLGAGLDYLFGNKIDYWIHDEALVFQPRTEWKYTGIVVLDEAVPIQVSRKQALPLYARATEQLIAAGAKGVYLDARLPKENEGIMPYAVCMEENGDVRWSQPSCSITGTRCQLVNSAAGNAPLKMPSDVFPFFKIAPYLDNQADLPDFLLYGMENEAYIPESGLVALDRLVTKNTPIARWQDITAEHASVTLAKFINPERAEAVLNSPSWELCDNDIPCRRIRFGYPLYATHMTPEKPIIPVSRLASCNAEIARTAAALLKNRVVILQLTTPTEVTDIVITPITTALFGPHLFTPGSQYLVDSIETLLANDYPQQPVYPLKLLLFLSVAILGVFTGIYLKNLSLVFGMGLVLLLLMSALCFLSPTLQLWPVTVTVITFLTGALQIVALHLLIGFKQGYLITQYMPKQVHKLLLSLKSNELFQNQRYQAIVLMSDLAGYTTVTSMLKEPMDILNLMNDYLDQTTLMLQNRYEGWLETYIGDMVCYYWPYNAENEAASFQNALLGAIELSNLQKRFFSELLTRYKNTFDIAVLKNISDIIDAGIGLSAGTVVMGDLGPKKGVKKFGILGDPMNLTSRVEALTRHFNSEIIITADFLDTAELLALPTRRLGNYRVKGREQSAMLYAIGPSDDPRFERSLINGWECWLTGLENESNTPSDCPDIFQQDREMLSKWKARGLLKSGIWNLEEK